jgi:hypothetical protein
MKPVLTTEKILATECRSTRITTDEKIRFAREIELAVLRQLRESENDQLNSPSQVLAHRLREIADEVEGVNSIPFFSCDLDGNGFSFEYHTYRGKVSVDVKTEPLW